jgi:hypothetical protein
MKPVFNPVLQSDCRQERGALSCSKKNRESVETNFPEVWQIIVAIPRRAMNLPDICHYEISRSDLPVSR